MSKARATEKPAWRPAGPQNTSNNEVIAEPHYR
jgi:hypothetical protein